MHYRRRRPLPALLPGMIKIRLRLPRRGWRRRSPVARESARWSSASRRRSSAFASFRRAVVEEEAPPEAKGKARVLAAAAAAVAGGAEGGAASSLRRGGQCSTALTWSCPSMIEAG
jgi:hypothetical protein